MTEEERKTITLADLKKACDGLLPISKDMWEWTDDEIAEYVWENLK